MRIAEVAFPVPLHKAYHYLVPEAMAAVPGSRVRAQFGPRRMVGTILAVFDGEPERTLKTLDAVMDPEPILPPELLECAVWMSRRYSAPVGECVRAVLPAFVKGVLPWAEPSPERPASEPRPGFTLTPGQSEALKTLTGRLEARAFHAALLYGVPASGKTEIYLRLIRKAVSEGGQALFLLPEISLTAPFFSEFAASLHVPVVLWHSKLGVVERRRAWFGLRGGEVKVVVGARSAALLPFKDLRLVVLDEEQDESFKQEGQSPLYHARDAALHRAQSNRSLVILGSATPSLETWDMARRGEAALLFMGERVSVVPRPKVSVLPVPAFGRCLSEELLAKLKDRLARREQSILLVNRRGFSTLLMCRQCGWVARCPHCGVAKIQHAAPDGSFELVCHHCSRRESLPLKCPQCANAALRASGIGTQKVVAELKRAVPGVRVLRMDRDALSKESKAERRIYERFAAREADVLVGTKLVAKSFHFPEVTLVGVVDADTMINMPDFRSAERTMQLLSQVAGRSGRAGKEGEVLLQSLHPEHIAVAGAVHGDYAEFADRELELRRELAYPPHSVLVRLILTGAKEEAVAEAGTACAQSLREEFFADGHEVLGPAPAVLRLASGKFRYHILLKVHEPKRHLDSVLSRARACELPSSVRMKINVDPYDLF